MARNLKRKSKTNEKITKQKHKNKKQKTFVFSKGRIAEVPPFTHVIGGTLLFVWNKLFVV